jgi:hypothetical protein
MARLKAERLLEESTIETVIRTAGRTRSHLSNNSGNRVRRAERRRCGGQAPLFTNRKRHVGFGYEHIPTKPIGNSKLLFITIDTVNDNILAQI